MKTRILPPSPPPSQAHAGPPPWCRLLRAPNARDIGAIRCGETLESRMPLGEVPIKQWKKPSTWRRLNACGGQPSPSTSTSSRRSSKSSSMRRTAMRKGGAIEPNQLRALVQETIELHLPPDQFEILKAAEEADR